MKVNKTLVNKVIKAIKNEPEKFYMGDFAVNSGIETTDPINISCNTAMCICGWVNHFAAIKSGRLEFEDDDDLIGYYGNIIRATVALVGSKCEKSIGDLFFMADFSLESFDNLPHKIRVDCAVDVLERFRDTGVVDWCATFEKFDLLDEMES